MGRAKAAIAGLIALLALGSTLMAYANDIDRPAVNVLVVFPAVQAPSKVYFATDGEFTRGLLLPFAAIANSVVLQRRSDELGAELDGALQGYDRYEVLSIALQAAFAQRSTMFEVTKTTDTATYLSGKGPSDSAREQGYEYVMVIEDVFSGLSMLNTLATRSDDVAPMATIRYSLYDAKRKKQVTSATASANGMTKKHIREATKDRDLFVSAYPEMAKTIALQVVGTLFRTDVLNAMAEAVKRGDEVPKVSAVLKKYERRFSYEIDPIEGWKRVKMTSPYVHVVEPRTDLRYQMGLRFEVDLLVPEFGQDVESVEAYLVQMTQRLADVGVDVSTLSEFSDLSMPDGYKVYSYAVNKDGGRNIVALRIRNEDMIEVVTVVVLKDFDALYPKHRGEIERNIAGAKLEVSGG